MRKALTAVVLASAVVLGTAGPVAAVPAPDRPGASARALHNPTVTSYAATGYVDVLARGPRLRPAAAGERTIGDDLRRFARRVLRWF